VRYLSKSKKYDKGIYVCSDRLLADFFPDEQEFFRCAGSLRVAVVNVPLGSESTP